MAEIDPPWRSMPLMNPINVKWRGLDNILIGGMIGDSSSATAHMQASASGKKWADVNLGAPSVSFAVTYVVSMAYGSGIWVASVADSSFGGVMSIYRSTNKAKTWSQVATFPYGIGGYVSAIPRLAWIPGVRTPGGIFAMMSGLGGSRSIDGGLTWSGRSFPFGGNDIATSLSAANNKLFTGVVTAPDNTLPTASVAVSTDGTSWAAHQIFGDFDLLRWNTDDSFRAGLYVSYVAYASKLKTYVCCGTLVPDETIPLPAIASSKDGVSWGATKYFGTGGADLIPNTDVEQYFIPTTEGAFPCIAASDDTFVFVAAYKKFNSSTHLLSAEDFRAGVSKDGDNWTWNTIKNTFIGGGSHALTYSAGVIYSAVDKLFIATFCMRDVPTSTNVSHVFTSPNGVTWTEQTSGLNFIGVGGSAFAGVVAGLAVGVVDNSLAK